MNCEEIKKLIHEENLQCCSSCHDDDDLVCFDLLDIYDENNIFIGQVCCRVEDAYTNWLLKRRNK